MLKLKRVDIQGFKSFCDRTELRFHGSGVTAIVGPNGCGKSNLSDAISWVLGEQSAKTLRGTRMEDVIFAGTRERKPLGMAQVTLTMADPAALAPIDTAQNGHVNGHANGSNGGGHMNGQSKPQEITITRRLYRSGESEYLMNGRTARLRDIQDLFTGTGLGPESYAIIEQGRIGQILSNKPADRRAIIEEAAGIGKYKTRKRLAEARLESARQNLSRVFDILEEVGRQVNSLKRQASKARRYEELRKDMIDHLRRAVSGRFRMLEREAAKLALELNQAHSAYQGLSSNIAGKELEYARVQESCYRTDAELTRARSRVADLNLESERTRGRLEAQAKEIGAIGERLGAGEAETQQLDAHREREASELASHLEGLGGIERETQSARARLDEKTRERDSLQQDVRGSEAAIEAARRDVLRLLGEASALRNQLAQSDEYLAGIERDQARANKEADAASGALARLEEAQTELRGRLGARQMALESLADRRRGLEEDIQTRQSRIAAARQKLEENRGALSRNKARKDSLEEILSHRAYTTESVKRLFLELERGQIENFRPAGVLADFVEVTQAPWEKACEEFLHEELEYVVVEGWGEAERGVDLMRTESNGRATFLIHSTAPGAGAAAAIPAELGVVGRLSEALRFTNGLAKETRAPLPRLDRCYLVSDRSAAQRLAMAYPDDYFLLRDGVSYHGHAVSGGRKATGGPLALKRELRELASQVETQGREADELAAELEELERATAGLAEELEHVRGLQQAQEKDALALDHEQRKLTEENARAGSQLSVARLELERLVRDDERSRREREQTRLVVTAKEQAKFDREKTLEEDRAQLERWQARLQSAAEEHSGLRAGLAGLEERCRSARASAERLETQLRQLDVRREDLAQELERMGVERARLLADNIELDQHAAKIAVERSEAAAEVDRLATLETQGRTQLAALDEGLKSLRIELQAAQEGRAGIELELAKKQAAIGYLDATSRRDLNSGAAEVSLGEETEPDEAQVAEAERRSEETRARIEALGPVNTQALEEFREAEQRYDFLNTQRQDLIDSIRDTEQAIQELDLESRRRFQEAFEGVNTHFREMFRTLFGGGQGEMRLTDETNLAESGIDIVASPPGKRLQNVLLLSGGEKSLTAMALLMAIFRYTPSPFCILDEVDAPLDESNIQRLTRLIKEMAAETQFIVITHAKKTMEAAQALYGVTMQEPGVSTLVSVKFDPLPAAVVQPPAAHAAV